MSIIYGGSPPCIPSTHTHPSKLGHAVETATFHNTHWSLSSGNAAQYLRVAHMLRLAPISQHQCTSLCKRQLKLKPENNGPHMCGAVNPYWQAYLQYHCPTLASWASCLSTSNVKNRLKLPEQVLSDSHSAQLSWDFSVSGFRNLRPKAKHIHPIPLRAGSNLSLHPCMASLSLNPC